jgi:hypothetical protein
MLGAVDHLALALYGRLPGLVVFPILLITVAHKSSFDIPLALIACLFGIYRYNYDSMLLPIVNIGILPLAIITSIKERDSEILLTDYRVDNLKQERSHLPYQNRNYLRVARYVFRLSDHRQGSLKSLSYGSAIL